MFVSGTFGLVTFIADEEFASENIFLFLFYSFIFLVFPILTLILIALVIRFVLVIYKKYFFKK